MISKNRRLRKLFTKQKGKCHYCQCPMLINVRAPALIHQRATIEHKTPTGRGGHDDAINTVAACDRCNKAKGPLTESEYLAVRNDPQELLKLVKAMHVRLQADAELHKLSVKSMVIDWERFGRGES